MKLLRILLLEDSLLDAELILTGLKESGLDSEAIRVEGRADYERALESERFDLILADYSLPSFDGGSALALARERCPEVPFIVISGALGEERAIEILKGGATDYVLKERLERLVPSIQRALREAEERAERQRLEDELRQRAQELAERDRRKDEFLAMLAHELRNPLGAMSNAAQVLKRLAPDEARLRRALETIERQISHQAHLVDDLLDVSRITRGKISLEREWLDLAWLIRHAVEDHASALEAAGLSLRLELPQEPVWFAGDRTRLAQVMGNLLTNAIKFTHRGGQVTVGLRIKDKDRLAEQGEPAFAANPQSAGPTLRVGAPNPQSRNPQSAIRNETVRNPVATVTIRDTGVGIDPAMLPHVFEYFAQADHSLDRSRGDLGLGLALAKGLIELHGGEVRADSRGLGCGAEFTFSVPVEPAGTAPRAVAASAGPDIRCRRILVVEDNRDAAETLRDVLELSGHEVTLAFSGVEGLAAVRSAQPELVLCDIGLPGMDGYAVARTLRQDPVTATVPLIALSGYGQEEDRRRAQEAGFDCHVTKPVNFAELEQLLLTMAPGAAF